MLDDKVGRYYQQGCTLITCFTPTAIEAGWSAVTE